jgi:hypothetical protein
MLERLIRNHSVKDMENAVSKAFDARPYLGELWACRVEHFSLRRNALPDAGFNVWKGYDLFGNCVQLRAAFEKHGKEALDGAGNIKCLLYVQQFLWLQIKVAYP